MKIADKRKMQRLENENAALKEELRKSWEMYSQCLIEIIEKDAKLKTVKEVVNGND